LAILVPFLDTEKIGQSFSQIQPQSLFLAGAITAFVLFVASVRWWLFVRSVRFPHRFWVSVRMRIIAQLLNVIVPSGVVGDGLQVFLVSRRPRVSGALALATILVDRLMALLVVTVVLVGTAWLLNDDMSNVVYATILSIFIVMIVTFVGILVAQKSNYSFRAYGRTGKLLKFVTDTMRAIGSFRNSYQTMLAAFVLAFVGVIGNSAVAWVLLSGLAEVQFVQLIPTFCLVMFSGLVPATLSGLGIREWIFFVTLSEYGLALEEAVALSLTLFGVMVLTAAILSVFSSAVSIRNGESVSWIRRVLQLGPRGT
jgi:glycosyltransferase 2 family protein